MFKQAYLEKKYMRNRRLVGGLVAAIVTSFFPIVAVSGETEVAGFVENATHIRESRGLTKFRNTMQLEFSKSFENLFGASTFNVNSTIRATYDGVYHINDKEFGKNAGGRLICHRVERLVSLHRSRTVLQRPV